MKYPLLKKYAVYFKRNRFKFATAAILMFWYVSMYPGRVGADTAGAIRLIQQGKSTDWWTAEYFWFLRISTINGQMIAATSFIQLIIFSFSLYWCMSAISTSMKNVQISYLIFISTPIFGVFGVTLGHDNLQVSGILILLGFELRRIRNCKTTNYEFWLLYSLSIFCLLTTHTGIILMGINLIILFIRKDFTRSIMLFIILLLLHTVCGIGTSNYLSNGKTNMQTSQVKYWTLIADLKCVSQHEMAEISNAEWQTLAKISSLQKWKFPMTCNNVDMAVNYLDIPSSNLSLGSAEFISTYLSISMKNPAIVAMARIQRARGLLPPPFFQWPDNQVVLDTKIPIGQGTGIALQSGPEVLHPSNDEQSVSVNVKWLKPINAIAQIPTFIVNQASWFWGWGGFWLWPILVYWLWKLRVRNVNLLLVSLHPILIMNTILFLTIPNSLARYYMFDICIGIFLSILMLVESLNKVQKK